MNGAEFIRRVRKVGGERHVLVLFEPRRGKGSHGTLRFGDRFTIVKNRRKDIGPGLLAKMLRDLRLSRTDIE